MSKLIVIDGQDRSGKDTLLKDFPKDKYIIYYQPTCEEGKIDYRNKKQFEEYQKKLMNQVFEDIQKISKENKDKDIVVMRLWISDEVYSDMFDREHITIRYKEKFENLFDNVEYFIFLWKSFEEFKKRMNNINDNEGLKEYSEEEFNKVKFLFEKYGKENGCYFFYIENNTPKELIYNFVKTII